jgi:uncharacterized membrane protein
MFTKADIEKYFVAEKQIGVIFFSIGIIAVLTALYLFFIHKGSMQKGIAIPLLIVGLIQAVVGFTVYNNSDKQRIDNVYAYDLNPSLLQNKEMPRMQKVVKSFTVYFIVEAVLFVIALLLIFLYRSNTSKQLLYGIGIGLAIQAAITFLADKNGAKRAAVYLNGLASHLKKNS